MPSPTRPGARPGRTRARRLAQVLAVLLTVGAAMGQAPDPAPQPAPDLAPRALEPEELDPVTIARIALRYDLDGIALDALAASGAPGLVLGVAFEGQTVLLEAYGSAEVGGRAMPLDAPLWLASLSKPLTAVAVLRLAADGRIDLDADVGPQLPEGSLGPPARPDDAPVTARDLLTHTAGLDVRLLGGTVPPGSPAPSAREAVATGLPPRIAAPGERLTYCNACYLALAALVEGATGLDQEAAYRDLVFDPLGFAHATIAADADAAYEAATVTPHAVGADGVTALAMPRLRESGAGRVRASAEDVMAFASALTAPEPPAELAGGVREALLTPDVRPHGAMPGWTLGMAESAVLGHPVVRQNGDLPGVRAALVVVPAARLAVFVYLNGAGGGDGGLEAASGARDARAVLVEAVVARLLGDARMPDEPARGWPTRAEPTDATALPAPAPGLYRFDRVAHAGPERMLAAAAPTFQLAVADGGARVDLVPPAALAAPSAFRRGDDGVWRRAGDGAPLVAVPASSPGAPERLLVHLGATAALERVAWLERPAVVLASHAAAAMAALLVLVSWPVGAILRWRRREPRAWTLPRAVGRVRAAARVGAIAAVGLLAVLGWLVARLLVAADAPLTAAAPLLQTLALILAAAAVVHVGALLAAAVAHPRHGLRWLWHAVVAVAFAALLAQGWVWDVWSPAALQATWMDLVGGPAVTAERSP